MDMKVEEGEVKAIADKLKKKVAMHKQKNPNDPLDIPFNDPEPQVTMPYGSKTPYHTQIHRDAFSYGDVGPRADPRVIVDLRFFGKQDVKPENRIEFVHIPRGGENRTNTDLYGMPQATVSTYAKTGHTCMTDRHAVLRQEEPGRCQTRPPVSFRYWL